MVVSLIFCGMAGCDLSCDLICLCWNLVQCLFTSLWLFCGGGYMWLY